MVTDANSGTGKEAARRLAGAGTYVVLGPEPEEGASADIPREHPTGSLEARALDLADLTSVRAFADTLLADGAAVDVLINNTGVMVPPTRKTTVDGFDLQVGTNVLGSFALINLCCPGCSNPRLHGSSRYPSARRPSAGSSSRTCRSRGDTDRWPRTASPSSPIC